jgi:hypothetical protein
MKGFILTAVIGLMATTAYAGGLTEQESACFDAINAMRAKAGLTPFTLSDELTDGARVWSKRLNVERRLYHSGFGGENCARGSLDGIATCRQWERSSGHRALLLSRTATEAGLGNDGSYWTLRVRSREREVVKQPKPVIDLFEDTASGCGEAKAGHCRKPLRAGAKVGVWALKLPVVVLKRHCCR